MTKRELRAKSYKESGEALKELVGQFMEDKVTNPIKNVFSKKSNKNNDEKDDE